MRAIHSGLEIAQRSFAKRMSLFASGTARLAVRIGIATGLVVVDDLIRDRVAEGRRSRRRDAQSSPHACRRSPSRTVSSPRTLRASSRAVVFVYCRSRLAASCTASTGADASLARAAHERSAESVRGGAQPAGLTRLDWPRRRTRRSLHGHWRDAAREHRPDSCLLTGEAGIGKSRLAETLADAASRASRMSLVRYQCSPYHLNTALHPFIHQLERAADPATRRRSRERKPRELEALLARRTGDEKRSDSACSPRCCPCPPWMRYPPPAHDTASSRSRRRWRRCSSYCAGTALRARRRCSCCSRTRTGSTQRPRSSWTCSRTVVATMPVLVVATSRVAMRATRLASSLQHARTLQLERLDRRHAAAMVSHLLDGRAPAGPMLVERDRCRRPTACRSSSKSSRGRLTDGRTAHGARRGDAATNRRRSRPTLQDSLMARLDQLGAAQEGRPDRRRLSAANSRASLLAAIAPLDATELTRRADDA